MGFAEKILTWIGPFVYEHPFFVLFFGPLIGGEPFFIALAFLSGVGVFPVWILFLTGTCADVLDDCFWFLFPRSKLFKKVKILRFVSKYVQNVNKKFKKIEKKELGFFILASKFLIGMRIMALVSLSLNKIKFKRFIFYSIICAFIWSCIIITIGWTVGRGFFLLRDIFNSTKIAVTIVLLIVFIILIIRHFIHRHVSRKLTHK